jgi:hypothetical protein
MWGEERQFKRKSADWRLQASTWGEGRGLAVNRDMHKASDPDFIQSQIKIQPYRLTRNVIPQRIPYLVANPRDIPHERNNDDAQCHLNFQYVKHEYLGIFQRTVILLAIFVIKIAVKYLAQSFQKFVIPILISLSTNPESHSEGQSFPLHGLFRRNDRRHLTDNIQKWITFCQNVLTSRNHID